MPELPYRPPRKPSKFAYEYNQTWGPIWLFLLGLGVAALFLLWPAFIWHGNSGGLEHDGWSWNGDTWVACGIWWGSLVLVALASWGLLALGKRIPPRDYTYPNPQDDEV